jgi:hypothetical protein
MYPAAAVPVAPPLRYTIDADAGFLVVELLSITDGPALLEALREIRADPRFTAALDICIDCNRLRAIPSCDEVKELARICVAFPRSGGARHWALIATWRPLYDAARFFATAVSAPRVTLRVFHAWSDARMWLATTRPTPADGAPWIGPSRALNELMSRSTENKR